MSGKTLYRVWTLYSTLSLSSQAQRLPISGTHNTRLATFAYMMSQPMCSLSAPKPMVGVVQMTSTPDKEANYVHGKALVERAKARGAQVIFLPECFDYVAESRKEAMAMAELINGPTISRYQELAIKNDVWLSLGGFHEKPGNGPSEDNRVFNTHVVIDNTGKIRGKYSKTHMFDLDIKGELKLKETDFTIPGSTIGPPVQSPVGNIGLAICYDMRFPELSLALRQQGADILTYPSAFTVPTGMAHWQTLLRARAIETQSYVIAAAQVGKHHAKRSSYGHSMIIDPWGAVICECHDKVDVCVAEIDLDYMNKRRIEMPVDSHRRPDLYGSVNARSNVPIDNQEIYQFGQVSIKSNAVFYRTALSYAFVNRKPVLPGHVLVSPIRVAKRFRDLTPAEVADVWQVSQKVSIIMEKVHDRDSVTFNIQDGVDAGQSIEHVHVHILPRKPGDFHYNDDIYEQLEKHDKNVKASEWRNDEDMAAEAENLRKYFV